MKQFCRLAIIGVGPSAIYLLKHLLDNVEQADLQVTKIYVFDKRPALGTGMPYDRSTTDQYNMCNISSAEIPQLDRSLVEWLHSLSDDELELKGISRSEIDDDAMYCRTTLGDYFQSQYAAIGNRLRLAGVTIYEHASCAVADVVDHRAGNDVEIHYGNCSSVKVDRVVIATGHSFHEPDEPRSGYYTSPWPIHKLIPDEGQFYNFEVGTLGASLSAFDVVSSLSHRHGEFVLHDDKLVYEPYRGTEGFKIALHSTQGWLPHLQYEQEEPFREIYRHSSRETMLRLVDEQGFLPLDNYFNKVCRPALQAAFEKDGRHDLVELLDRASFSLEAFIGMMSDEHSSDDPFAIIRAEMPEAKRSLRKGIPIHWKEVLDDLMFTLNFHYELLSAEDHLRYRKTVVPFLMNVIAAMPLSSAQILLALNETEKLELIRGRVTVKGKVAGKTFVEIENEGEVCERAYRMFIDCSGQGSLGINEFPFSGLIGEGTVAEAVARFRTPSSIDDLDDYVSKNIVDYCDKSALRLGGIAIDGYYRIVGKDGLANNRIYDVAFPHATGVRPYSYGLQACDATASIVVASWREKPSNGKDSLPTIEEATQIYDDLPEPS